MICTLIFFGYGLNKYAELEYYQFHLVVLCDLDSAVDYQPVAVALFNYGQIEWLWRSLTYWRRQPFRRIANALPRPIESSDRLI